MATKIEFYQGSDPLFFHTRKKRIHDPIEEYERSGFSREYDVLLDRNSERLDEALNDGSNVKRISPEVFRKLDDLAGNEIRHSERINHKIDNFENLLGGYGYSKLTEAQKSHLCVRTMIHLVRMLMPEDYSADDVTCVYPWLAGKEFSKDYCHSFGKELMESLPKICPPDITESFIGQEISNRIGSEGIGVFTFWTLAPYVYLGLKELGNSQEDSFGKMFRWIMKGKEGFEFYPPYTNYKSQGIHKLTHTLGYDERMPSHLMSRLLSKITAAEVNNLPVI